MMLRDAKGVCFVKNRPAAENALSTSPLCLSVLRAKSQEQTNKQTDLSINCGYVVREGRERDADMQTHAYRHTMG